MSDTYFVIGEDTLGDIADAIRTKRGYSASEKIKVADYADEIDDISTTLEQLCNPETEDYSVELNSNAITIPDDLFGDSNGVSAIGKKIGGACSLPECTSIGGYAFKGTKITSLNSPKVTSVGAYAFSGCADLVSVGDLHTVSSLGNYAFINCSNLEGDFYLPNVTSGSISQVFSGCSKITSARFPNATGNCMETFYNCTSLISADIGQAKVTSQTYALRAFSGCTNLRSVVFRHTSKQTYYSGMWVSDKSNITIIVPADLVSTYEADSNWSGAGFAGFAALTTTLTIGEDSYTCNEGETWADFVNSVNNTDGLVVVGNMVYNAAKTAYVTNGGKAVYPFDIVTGNTYALTAI